MNRRHLINLCTGIVGCVYTAYLWWSVGNFVLSTVSNLVLCTTLLYHGSHVLGHVDLANRVFLKYDVTAVATSALTLFVQAPTEASREILLTLGGLLTIWLLSFHSSYTHLPFNPVASIIHLVAVRLNVSVASTARL